MSNEPTADKPPGYPWAAGAAGLLAAGLLAAGGYAVYRQTIITGSVIGAWHRLMSGGWDTVAFVALTVGVPVLCVFLALGFLAPRIVEAIAEGRQPPELTVIALARRLDLPTLWSAQEVSLGIR